MSVHGTVGDGDQRVSVEVAATGDLLRITGPYTSKPACFEGRACLTLRDRLVNWFHLATASGRPLRCAFASVSLKDSPDETLMTVDPGWPWAEPIVVALQPDDRRILDDWNRAALDTLCGKSVRCILVERGFVIADTATDTERGLIHWNDVREVRAFKRDLLSHDMICLAFRLSDNACVEIWEESEGFSRVTEQMAKALPDIPAAWLTDISVPAFAPMDTLLHRRDHLEDV